MDEIIPWRNLCKVIKPFYPQPKGAGRPPVGLERMLRIHFLQHGFNLSDPAVEEALYDSRAMRRFVGIDLGRESAPARLSMRRSLMRQARPKIKTANATLRCIKPEKAINGTSA